MISSNYSITMSILMDWLCKKYVNDISCYLHTSQYSSDINGVGMFFDYCLDIKTKDWKNIKQWQSNKRTEHQNLSKSTKNCHALSYKLTLIWPCKRLSININRGSVVSSLTSIIYKGNPDRNHKVLKTVSTWKHIFHTEKLPACYYIWM